VDRASSTLKAKAFLGLANLAAVVGVLVFVPAGTWRYREGWVFLVLFSACALAISVYLMRRDPGLLERRVAAGPIAERRTRQKVIQALASTAFLSIIVVPALDRRFGWSHVPLPLVVVGDALVALGFLIVFRVFRENTFASALIEVGTEQKVIDTGPYAWVRHPMYAGALVLLAGIPLALGSFWGLLTLPPFTGIIAWRMLDEETFLERELPGYRQYRGLVRHRLVPGVW
jgi:protein-S-isoprenylcysteine O-methyltransferase Ste14